MKFLVAHSSNDMRVRRLSIADRVNRRRNTEFAFEFTRLAAMGRAEEFFRLLEEHSRLVHSVQFWSTAGKRQVINPKALCKSISHEGNLIPHVSHAMLSLVAPFLSTSALDKLYCSPSARQWRCNKKDAMEAKSKWLSLQNNTEKKAPIPRCFEGPFVTTII